MYYITYGTLGLHLEFWLDVMPEEERTNRRHLMEKRFWDALEIATRDFRHIGIGSDKC
jgi:hypothetical protein